MMKAQKLLVICTLLLSVGCMVQTPSPPSAFSPTPPLVESLPPLFVTTSTPDAPSQQVSTRQAGAPANTTVPRTLPPSSPTPEFVASCPSISETVAPTPTFLGYFEDRFSWPADSASLVTSYLNRYGVQPLLTAHDEATQQGESWGIFLYQDLTGDEVPELMLAAPSLYIFGCQSGAYQVLFQQTEFDGYASTYQLEDIGDINRNGFPEMLFITARGSQGGHYYQVLEWEKQNFRDLIAFEKPNNPARIAIGVEATGEVHFADIDNDGIQELVANSGLPVWANYRDGLPWRNERRVFSWDGQNYLFEDSRFDAPQYRFQAVQDGDQFALKGQYDMALELYQQAIFSDTLEWWSPERQMYLQFEWDVQHGGTDITPVAPLPDANEYFALAAYARYRIMLLHLARGWVTDAQTVYETLQEKFLAEQAGHIYAEMAAEFWQDYEKTAGNLASACQKAIDFAEAHPELLIPLGSDYHGWQSKYYGPEDVCPFR